MAATTEHGERLAAIESELATERPHLATKADISRLEGKLNVVIIVILGGFGVLIPLILTQG